MIKIGSAKTKKYLNEIKRLIPNKRNIVKIAVKHFQDSTFYIIYPWYYEPSHFDLEDGDRIVYQIPDDNENYYGRSDLMTKKDIYHFLKPPKIPKGQGTLKFNKAGKEDKLVITHGEDAGQKMTFKSTSEEDISEETDMRLGTKWTKIYGIVEYK